MTSGLEKQNCQGHGHRLNPRKRHYNSDVRQAGFDAIQQEQMVLKYVREHGEIGRKDAADLCRLSKDQASQLLRKMLSENKLVMAGKGRGVHYRLP